MEAALDIRRALATPHQHKRRIRMSDYRCRDMQQVCNHAGHIDALEGLVDTLHTRIRELEAERDAWLKERREVKDYR